jgi:hypothetical protein
MRKVRREVTPKMRKYVESVRHRIETYRKPSISKSASRETVRLIAPRKLVNFFRRVVAGLNETYNALRSRGVATAADSQSPHAQFFAVLAAK